MRRVYKTHVFHDLPERLAGLGVDVPLVDEVEEDLVEVGDERGGLLHAVHADEDGARELDEHEHAHGDHGEEERPAPVPQHGQPAHERHQDLEAHGDPDDVHAVPVGVPVQLRDPHAEVQVEADPRADAERGQRHHQSVLIVQIGKYFVNGTLWALAHLTAWKTRLIHLNVFRSSNTLSSSRAGRP